MQRGLTGAIAAADADPHASEPPVRRRRTFGYAIVGLVAYGLALIATLPARFIVHADPRWAVTGTIWRGEAVLDGAYRIEWRWAPFRSLAKLGFAADWRMAGNGTDVAGSAIATAGRLTLEGVSGRGDAALLSALVQDLPFACEASLTIDIPRLVLSDGKSAMEGEVRSETGRCAASRGAPSQTVPPLILRATRDKAGVTAATLAPVAQPRIKLAEANLAGGRLTVAPTQAGIALLPFLREWRFDRRW